MSGSRVCYLIVLVAAAGVLQAAQEQPREKPSSTDKLIAEVEDALYRARLLEIRRPHEARHLLAEMLQKLQRAELPKEEQKWLKVVRSRITELDVVVTKYDAILKKMLADRSKERTQAVEAALSNSRELELKKPEEAREVLLRVWFKMDSRNETLLIIGLYPDERALRHKLRTRLQEVLDKMPLEKGKWRPSAQRTYDEFRRNELARQGIISGDPAWFDTRSDVRGYPVWKDPPVLKALASRLELDPKHTTIESVLAEIRRQARIEVTVDEESLKAIKGGVQSRATIKQRKDSVSNTLDQMLMPHGLTHVIREGKSLQIVTLEKARAAMITHRYLPLPNAIPPTEEYAKAWIAFLQGIDPPIWKNGASIKFDPKDLSLVIHAPEEFHLRLGLDGKKAPPPPKTPPRSMKVENFLQAVVRDVLTNPEWEDERASTGFPTQKDVRIPFQLADGSDIAWPSWFEPAVAGFDRCSEKTDARAKKPVLCLILESFDILEKNEHNVDIEMLVSFSNRGGPASLPIIYHLKREGEGWAIKSHHSLSGRMKRLDQ